MSQTSFDLKNPPTRWVESIRSLQEITGADLVRLFCVSNGDFKVLAQHSSAKTDPLAVEFSVQNNWAGQHDGFVREGQFILPVFHADSTHFGLIELLAKDPAVFSEPNLRLARLMRGAIEDQLALQSMATADVSGKLDELRRAQEGRRLAEQRFHLLVENSLDAFYMHDDKGRLLDVNDRACESLGYTRAELMQMKADDLSLDLTQQEKEDIYDITPPGASVQIFDTHTRKDGTTFPVEVKISCHLLAGEKIFLGIARDLSEQIEARKTLQDLNDELEKRVLNRTLELKESSDRLMAIMDTATDAISLTDSEGRFLQLNAAAGRLLGCDPNELLGRSLDQDANAATMPDFFKHSPDAMLSGTTTVEERLMHFGTERFFLTTRTARKDAEGRVTGLVTLSHDITERKRAENELRLEQERMILAAEVGGLGIMDYHFDDRSLIANDELCRIFGLTEQDICLETLLDCVHPEDRALLQSEVLENASEVNRDAIPIRLICKDDGLRWVMAAGRLVPAVGFAQARVICVIRDVTETYLAERQLQQSYFSLQQAERLARIGSWTLDPRTSVFTSSDMMLEMNGIEPGKEITIASLQQMMPPADFARVGAAIENCIKTGEAYGVDVTHFSPTGGSFAAEIRGQALRDDDGQVIAVSGTVQNVSEREATRAQMAAIADSLPNGALYRIDYLSPEIGLNGAPISSDEMHLSYVSAGIERLIGVTAEALIADPSLLLQAIHEDDRAHYLETSQKATIAQSNFECDFRIVTSDGSIRWLQIRSAPRPQDEGRIWDGIILDVTRAYETAEALRHAKETAEAAERAKGQFLATMSHEIRTPMNAVIGMTRLAMQTDLSPRQQNYLDKIDTSARILLGIINDILDFSRIEAGGLELEVADFTMESILETLSNATSLKAEEKGLEIVYSVSPAVPKQLRGDPLRLGQVLINLVGNAVKFTEKGEIVVSVDLQPNEIESAPPLLRFSVRDTGIGLDDDQMSALFRPFAQADTRTARRFGGTGLGLSISKQLVELMGGKISVDSQPGSGSTFSFTTSLQTPLEITSATSQMFKNKRALIVDDVASSRETLSSMMAQFGVLAKCAPSGAEAITMLHEAAAQNRPFDVVLMDWRMPGMDGIETARKIRNDAFLRTTPAVLMVTAHAGDEIMRNVDALELQGLLIKPVTESMLFNAIQLIFDVRGPSHSAGGKEVATSTPAILRGSRVLVVDDNLFNLEVAKDFLELAGVQVTTAESGFEALDRLEASRFDVVLMDMQMPEMDGLETTRRIRNNPALHDLPVIALTAQAGVEDREATLLVGMSAHLTKPIDEKLMYSTIVTVLEEQRRATESARQLSPAIDLSQTLMRVRGDHARMERMIELFIRDFSDCPRQLRVALETSDFKALSAVAHRIRGVAGYFAADRLYKNAELVELKIYDNETDDVPPLTIQLIANLEEALDACNIELARFQHQER
ncbi:PAS domain S-box protein [Paracoccus sp. (in: a-proteobacteria)]|uniref:PAS domain S-box protein n=1 Tax=Paracoccus sp. TaxID=267 RepID=UPI00289BBFE9|nr:PAS domain S-box protein [Paracoccus sp. (in: a-proteobacteria)]